MTQKIDLKELERNAFRTAFQDGMTDVMLGSVMVVLSLVPLFESLALKRPFGYLISFAILAAVWAEIKVIKTRFITPRLGLVTFSSARKNRMKRARVALAVMVLVTVGLVILTATGTLQGVIGVPSAWRSYLFIGAIFVVTLSLLAFFLDNPRLYLYGWFFAAMYPFSEWLAAKTDWVFPSGETIFGIIIVFIGIMTYIHFLRQHPLPALEKQLRGGGDG